jgi:excisionase family DNA binding protein
MIKQENIQSTVESLAAAFGDRLSRPVYLRIAKAAGGELIIEHVSFVTPEQLAELAHVERRTVYSWIERAERIGLKYYRPPGSRGILFELNELLDWLKAGRYR